MEKPYSKLVIFNITVPHLSMSTSPIVLSPSSSVGRGNKSQRTHTTDEGHISPGCGLSSYRVFKEGTVWEPEWLAQAIVMSPSCCDVPAISEKVGDTRSPWCGLSSDGVFKKGTVWGPEWLPQAVVISLPYQAKLIKQCYYTYPWVE